MRQTELMDSDTLAQVIGLTESRPSAEPPPIPEEDAGNRVARLVERYEERLDAVLEVLAETNQRHDDERAELRAQLRTRDIEVDELRSIIFQEQRAAEIAAHRVELTQLEAQRYIERMHLQSTREIRDRDRQIAVLEARLSAVSDLLAVPWWSWRRRRTLIADLAKP